MLTVVEDGNTVLVTFPPEWLHVARMSRVKADGALAILRGAQFVIDGVELTSRLGTDKFLLRDITTGLNIPSSVLDQGATVWVKDGVAGGAYGGSAPAGASVAIQGWPSLVVSSTVTATNTGTNSERDTREGIGVTSDGRILVAHVLGTMTDLANRMRDAGATTAAYLDGGSSSQLRAVTSAGIVRRDSPRAVGIPTYIYAAPPSGAQSNGGSADGTGEAVLVGGTIAAVGLLGWLATR